MLSPSIERLQFLLDTIPTRLHQISEADFAAKPKPEKWSKKEVMGHLIDSAANNHQRFVRAQFEPMPSIFYDQNKWNAFNYYQAIDKKQIITLWEVYNRQFLALFPLIPQEKLSCLLFNGGESPVTLGYVMTDYVVHLEHHLQQVISYK